MCAYVSVSLGFHAMDKVAILDQEIIKSVQKICAQIVNTIKLGTKNLTLLFNIYLPGDWLKLY